MAKMRSVGFKDVDQTSGKQEPITQSLCHVGRSHPSAIFTARIPPEFRGQSRVHLRCALDEAILQSLEDLVITSIYMRLFQIEVILALRVFAEPSPRRCRLEGNGVVATAKASRPGCFRRAKLEGRHSRHALQGDSRKVRGSRARCSRQRVLNPVDDDKKTARPLQVSSGTRSCGRPTRTKNSGSAPPVDGAPGISREDTVLFDDSLGRAESPRKLEKREKHGKLEAQGSASKRDLRQQKHLQRGALVRKRTHRDNCCP